MKKSLKTVLALFAITFALPLPVVANDPGNVPPEKPECEKIVVYLNSRPTSKVAEGAPGAPFDERYCSDSEGNEHLMRYAQRIPLHRVWQAEKWYYYSGGSHCPAPERANPPYEERNELGPPFDYKIKSTYFSPPCGGGSGDDGGGDDDGGTDDCIVLRESWPRQDSSYTYWTPYFPNRTPIQQLRDPKSLNIVYEIMHQNIRRPGFFAHDFNWSELPAIEDVVTYLTRTESRTQLSGCTDPAGGINGVTTSVYNIQTYEVPTTHQGWSHSFAWWRSSTLIDSGTTADGLNRWSIRETKLNDNIVTFRNDDILSDPYTTQQFLSDGQSMMPDFSGSFHFATTWPGNISVSYGMGYYGYWRYHSNLHYNRVRFQLRWGEEMEPEDRHPVRYYVLFTPWNDPETEDVDESELTQIIPSLEINWSGDAAQSPVYTIDPGQIDPYSFGNYSLFEASLRPDYDRDGRINNADLTWLKENSKDNEWVPFHFWINDNNDTAEDDGNDVPGAGSPDYNSSGVQTVRDLIDFFPVAVYLPSQMNYQLRKPLEGEEESPRISLSFKGSAFNRIVYPDTFDGILPTDAGKYLRDPELAREIAQMDTASLASGSELSEHERDLISKGRTVFLFEGRQASNEPVELILEITMPGGGTAEVPLRVQLSSVEDMYRRVNIANVIPGTSANTPTATGDPHGWPDAYTKDRYFVFLHGYRVSQQEARGWHSQMFKRLFWSGSRARFVGVTWHGDTGLNYYRAVKNAFLTSENLGGSLSFIDPNQTVIAAHSLGNMVVSNALTRGNPPSFSVDQYFMLNAAVPVEAYDPSQAVGTGSSGSMWSNIRYPQWSDYADRVTASFWHELFADGKPDANGNPVYGDYRQQITWKGRFSQIDNAWNFFSTGEEVLRNASGTVPTLASQFYHKGPDSWTFQEMNKGRSGLHVLGLSPTHGGWGFSEEPTYWAGSTYYPPSVINALDDAQLRSEPFFLRFRNSSPNNSFYNGTTLRNALGDSSASTMASLPFTQYKLLAEAIPATSFAAGANAMADAFGELNNIDMNTQLRVPGEWPPARPNSNWEHSDLKDVAYPYVYRFFDRIIELGDLK